MICSYMAVRFFKFSLLYLALYEKNVAVKSQTICMLSIYGLQSTRNVFIIASLTLVHESLDYEFGIPQYPHIYQKSN